MILKRNLFGVVVLTLLSLFAISRSLDAAPGSTTFTITSKADAVDSDLTDNQCKNSGLLGHPCTLRAAIQQANATSGADTIIVPAGTYTLTIAGLNEGAAATGDLDISGDTTILGAGTSQTFINANAIDRVFEISSTARVVISGVVIQAGRDNAGYPGGGVLNHGALQLTNTVLIHNSSNSSGGAIYNYGVITLTNTDVVSNHANIGGGGIGNFGQLLIMGSRYISNTAAYGGALSNSGSAILQRVVISQNIARFDNSTGAGGGILSSSALIMTDVVILHNMAAAEGGGLALYGRTTLNRVTILSNTASGSFGGGIRFVTNMGPLDMTDVVISGNVSYGEGGGVFLEGAVALNRVAIVNNQSGQFGGGVFISGTVSSVNMVNTTVSANALDSGAGGGIYNIGTLVVTNSTIVSNSAPAFGSAIYGGVVRARNTVLGKYAGGPNACQATVTSFGHNLDNDGTCNLTAAGDISHSSSLGLRPLAQNGSNTWFHLPLAGGPLIDAGDNVGCPIVDQRLNFRPLDGNGDSVSICDIGAAEYGVPKKVFLPLVLKDS